jgi:hypothetical protein
MNEFFAEEMLREVLSRTIKNARMMALLYKRLFHANAVLGIKIKTLLRPSHDADLILSRKQVACQVSEVTSTTTKWHSSWKDYSFRSTTLGNRLAVLCVVDFGGDVD